MMFSVLPHIARQPGATLKNKSFLQDTEAILQGVLSGLWEFYKKSSVFYDKSCIGNAVVDFEHLNAVGLQASSEGILERVQNCPQ